MLKLLHGQPDNPLQSVRTLRPIHNTVTIAVLSMDS